MKTVEAVGDGANELSIPQKYLARFVLTSISFIAKSISRIYIFFAKALRSLTSAGKYVIRVSAGVFRSVISCESLF